MYLFPQNYRRLIAKYAYDADQLVRDELHKGIITSERDYVSNLTRELRNKWNTINGVHCYAKSLNFSDEQKYGCDGVMVFINSDKQVYKVGLFEAKWPRLSHQQPYKWDSISQKLKISHFSHQLQRQSNYQNHAIWELFIIEYAFYMQPKQFDNLGSTCIWHNLVYSYDSTRNKRKIWDNQHLYTLVSNVPKYFFTKNFGKNIGHMVNKILLCREAKPLQLNNKVNFEKMFEDFSFLLILEYKRG